MLAVVIKRGFVVNGEEVDAGTIIETDGMRNVEVALRTRHLRAASASEIAARESKTKNRKP